MNLWQGENGPAAQDLPLWCQCGTWCQPECSSGRLEGEKGTGTGWRDQGNRECQREQVKWKERQGEELQSRSEVIQEKWKRTCQKHVEYSSCGEEEYQDQKEMDHNQSPTNLVLGMAGRQTGGPGNNTITESGICKG